MRYRNFTRDKLRVSQLGFGCMRLPILGDDIEKIDYDKASQLLDLAIDNGVNYIDTAFPYHGGNSEIFVGDYFQKNKKRDQVYVATKCPVWKAEKKGDFYGLLKLQLERLQMEYVDFYLLHALNGQRWGRLQDLDVFEDMQRAKAEGLIRYLGFSFHDDYQVFEEICQAYDWDFVQIQLNYLDINYQAGLKGLEFANKKGFSVIVMEPIKGGKLSNLPADIAPLFEGAEYDLSPSGHALSFLWDRKGVSLVLSGMSSLDQVEDNLKTADLIGPDSLTIKDRDRFIEAKIAFDSRVKVDCSSCNYCMPCSQGVSIPDVLAEYNDLHIFEDESKKDDYQRLLDENKGADSCVSCHQCEAVCPQQIPIAEELKKAHKILTEDNL